MESRGVKCWIAPRNLRAGKEYSEEIVIGIDQSECLLVVLSESANNSIYVKREVERAVSYGKAVYPFRIEDVEPSRALELFISSAHWVNAWQGSIVDHIDKLVEDLKELGNEAFARELKTLSFADKILRFAQRNLNAVITISVVVLLGIVLISRTDQPHQIDSENLPIKQDNLSLVDFQIEDYPLTINFDLDTYEWQVFIEAPKKAHAAAIASAQISVDKTQWMMLYNGGVTRFSAEQLGGDHVWLKIADANGNRIDPMRLDINLDALKQVQTRTLNVNTLDPKLSFDVNRGWSVEFSQSVLDYSDFIIEYRTEKNDWQSASSRNTFTTKSLAGAQYLEVRFKAKKGQESLGPYKIIQDFNELAYEQLYPQFSEKKFRANCSIHGCNLTLTKSNLAPTLSLIKYIHYGIKQDKLSFTHSIDIPSEQLFNRDYHKEHEVLHFETPNCGMNIFYQFELKNGDKTKTQEARMSYSAAKPCNDELPNQVYSAKDKNKLTQLASNEKRIESLKRSIDKRMQRQQNCNLKYAAGENWEAVIAEVGGYGKLSTSQQSSYNDNRKSISACVADENYEKRRGTAKKEQDRLVELQQENQKIKLELTKQ